MAAANDMVDRKPGPGHRQSLRFLMMVTLTLVFLGSGCASNAPAVDTGAAVPESDPDLAADEKTAGDGRTQSEGARWRWQDATESWQFDGRDREPALVMDGWVFEKDAIHLRLTAPSQLNRFRERPHSVVIKILQLSDRQPFTDSRQSAPGLQRVLADVPFDASVVAVESRVLHPGADLLLSVDRVANARFVAVVAGYFSLDGKTTTRLMPIPVIAPPPASGGILNTLSFGALGEKDAPPPRPAHLKILLELGAESIESARVQAH